MSDKITIRHIKYVHGLQHILLALGMDADLKIPEKSDGKETKQYGLHYRPAPAERSKVSIF